MRIRSLLTVMAGIVLALAGTAAPVRAGAGETVGYAVFDRTAGAFTG
ncbi:MAG TPA: hypothetical protein VN408_14035 [Actinoplanes sp.]|nr:hypothetical protein [Actinoplanes sp.]